MRNHDRDSNSQAISEINVTPLVDVMLCLLIIFMIAAPILSKRLPLNLPQPTPTIPPPPLEPPMLLRILSDGRLLLEDRPIQDQVLAAELAFQAHRDPARVLLIDPDRDAGYQRFVDVLAQAREQGVQRIAFAEPSLAPR